MNNTCFDCDVVRDLMPLVIDDAASGTSRGIVETHLKECPACRAAMEEMRTELAERRATPEDRDFVRFVKNTGKKLRRKKWIAVLGAIIGLIGIVVGVYSYLATHSRHIELTPENVMFALDEEGYLTWTHTIEKDLSYHGMGSVMRVGEDAVYFHISRSMAPDLTGEKQRGTIQETVNWIYWNGEELVHKTAKLESIDDAQTTVLVEEPLGELRVGTPEDYFVLYRAGDVLTPGEVIEISE